MIKMMYFADKTGSYVAGFTYVLAINTLLIMVLLLSWLIAYYFGNEQIGVQFVVLYLFNLLMFTNHLFTLLATQVAKADKYRTKMDVGVVVGCAFIIALVIFIANSKFNLEGILLHVLGMFTLGASLQTALRFRHVRSSTISEINMTTDKDEVDGKTFFIEKKKLITLSTLFIIVSIFVYTAIMYFLITPL